MSVPLPQVLIAERSQPLPNMREHGWGRMWVLLNPRPVEGEPVGFDNGAFRDWTAGRRFDAGGFRKRLQRAHAQLPRPIVAVCPDIVACGAKSLAFSLEWRAELPDDWPWFLAVQDGMAFEQVEDTLERYAGIFLGGTNHFKYGAPNWARLARKHGKQFHYGRAGTPRKLAAAFACGADSLDSSFPLWTKARLAEFEHLWQTLPHRLGTTPSLLDYL